MSVIARKRQHGTTYYAVFTWQGERVWEHAGTDRREAERLEKRRRAEVARGTYVPPSDRRVTTFGAYVRAWLDKRANRTSEDDAQRVRDYVLSRAWLAEMPIADVRPKHMARLVEELKATPKKSDPSKPLSPKSVSNTYGAIRTMFRDARLAELTDADPCAIPRGLIPRKVGRTRTPYTREEVEALTSAGLAPERMLFNLIAFYTGMREGEICARRFRDWDRSTRPLGRMVVDSQYDDQPLKTDDEQDARPRAVPVHPKLADMLDAWWRWGFEAYTGRRPTPDDRIVPHLTLGTHTKSSAYKMWRRSCAVVGVTNRSLHSTRHTFISMCRRGGARKEAVERITHNSKGDIVDGYTHFDWAPLCAAVQCWGVDVSVDAPRGEPTNQVPAPVSIPGASTELDGKQRESDAARDVDAARIPREVRPQTAGCAARQQPPWPHGPAREFRVDGGVVRRVA